MSFSNAPNHVEVQGSGFNKEQQWQLTGCARQLTSQEVQGIVQALQDTFVLQINILSNQISFASPLAHHGQTWFPVLPHLVSATPPYQRFFD